MPYYHYICPDCRHRTVILRKMTDPATAPHCGSCGRLNTYRDFSAVHMIAMPVAFQDHNRVSDADRKVYAADQRRYDESVAGFTTPTMKPKTDIHQTYAEACGMFNAGEARGVTFEQAKAEGLDV